MSVSTLANFFTSEKQMLLVGGTFNKKTKPFETPSNYYSISLYTFRNMVRNYDYKRLAPNAILIDFNVVSTAQILPIIRKIKTHKVLKNIPIIALRSNFSPSQRLNLLKRGFSDCFIRPIDWDIIEQRIDFLNKYQQQLSAKQPKEEKDIPYQMQTGKRVFDIMVASILLLLLAPLFLIIAILIKLESKGPVFYTSKRVGTGYQIFDFIKFRSMEVGSAARLVNLSNYNNYKNKMEDTLSNKATFYKIKNDPRVTKVGKFIRKTSIDELPQLINVLRGEMSIVGNRPLPLYEADKLTCDDWAKRFLAPAGLTGLWQTDKRGKDNLETEERIRLDMDYADKFSFLLDFKILLKTFPAIFQKE